MTRLDFSAIPAGRFEMGAEQAPHPEDGEGPLRSIRLGAFAISTTTVTNAAFATFAEATGYRTTAELRGSSHVFFAHLDHPEAHPSPLAEAPWWREVKGACWRRPDGQSAAQADHPVVHVSYFDALAYCDWAKVRLPTEAEWEYAAQGADQGQINIWSGAFPNAPIGNPGTRAAQSGTANSHGLFNACGNVWEWTADGFGRLHSPREATNPSGNLRAVDKVVKGGSYLCAPSYCARFRPSSRRAEHPEASAGHMGFRVVKPEP